MLLSRRIAVVIPAFREAPRIGATVASVPAFVDDVIVVDDASDDGTLDAARRAGDARLVPIRHDKNQGVGAAIASGYRTALARGADVMAVMAGDGQMDPADLEAVVTPVARGDADYVKGNRFVHRERRAMPLHRRAGSAALAALTRAATGLSVDDTQCGYTALSAAAARALPLSELWPRYGYPNDLLGLLAARGLSVTEVPVRPVYAGEPSGLRPWHLLTIAGVIARRAVIERRRAHSVSEAAPGPAVVGP